MPLWTDPVPEGKTVAVLGNSGIVLGAEDAFGCRWRWESNDPWSPSPPVRAVTGDRAAAHGSWDATRFYGSRRPEFKGTVVAPNHLALHQAKQRLFDAITVEPFPLRVVEPGFDRYATVRREGEVLWTEMGNTVAASWSLSLSAPDPVVYSTTKQVFGLPAAYAVLPVVNEGGLAVPPTLEITGPTSYFIRLVQGTREMVIANYLGDPVVPAGDRLYVDMERRWIVTQAGVSRRSWMSGKWWDLPVGESTVTVDLTTDLESYPGPGAGVLMRWREGWI